MLLPDLQRLARIRDYCELIGSTVGRFGGTYEHFIHDTDFQQSISFSILQIGELAGSLSEELRNATSAEMNWSQIKGMRNIVAHHYGKIDFGIVGALSLTIFQSSRRFATVGWMPRKSRSFIRLLQKTTGFDLSFSGIRASRGKNQVHWEGSTLPSQARPMRTWGLAQK